MAAIVDSSRYGDLCRLCATKTTLVIGINIFENEATSRQICKKIESCLPVRIHQADLLPKMICENCLYKLELFFDFRERSIRTERLLLELVKELSTEKIQNDLDIIALDHNGLIMVPHQHLLDSQQLQNVEVDVSHLHSRDGIIVEHEMLNHEHVDITHLNDLAITHSSLAQNISHEQILLDSTNSHNLHDNQFEDNLDMIHQQQLLNQQFRMQSELNIQEVNMAMELHEEIVVSRPTTLPSMSSTMSLKDKPLTSLRDKNKLIDSIEYNPSKHSADPNIINGENPQCTNFSRDNIKDESMCQDDSNSSDNKLIIADKICNTPNKVYIFNDNSINNNINMSSVQQLTQSEVFCEICFLSFNDQHTLDKHYEEHLQKCFLCSSMFTSIEILNEHIKEVHENKDEVDDVTDNKTYTKRATQELITDADVTYNRESDLDDIRNNTAEEDDLKNDVKPTTKKKNVMPKVCKECGKTYKSNYKLKEHMRKHTGETPYKCNSCEKGFRSKIGLSQHQAKHTGQFEFACPTCGKGFQNKSYLMVHQRVHSDIKPYPCTTCGTNFKSKQSLLDHTNRHLGLKPHICDICGRGFITKGLCKTHQKVHTGLDNRKYSCKICSKRFVSKSYLQTHLKIHTGEKPFICEVCGKGFLVRVDLRIHSTMHTGEKSYVCEICGKAFARRDALRCHRRSHTGERPYSCDLCGQTFTQFTPMAIHKRLHTGERPYSCEVCKKTFVSRSTMRTHAKSHVR